MCAVERHLHKIFLAKISISGTRGCAQQGRSKLLRQVVDHLLKAAEILVALGWCQTLIGCSFCFTVAIRRMKLGARWCNHPPMMVMMMGMIIMMIMMMMIVIIMVMMIMMVMMITLWTTTLVGASQ